MVCQRRTIAGNGRKLRDIYQKDGSEITTEGPRRIVQFYRIEASIRGYAPEDRFAIRQAQSAPLTADLPQVVNQQRAHICAKSVRQENNPPDCFVILFTWRKPRLYAPPLGWTTNLPD